MSIALSAKILNCCVNKVVLRIWEVAVPVLFSVHALCTCIFPSNEFQCYISLLPHFRVTSLQFSSPKICQIFNHWMQDLSFNHAWRIDTKRFLLLDPFLSISIQWFYRNFQHKPSSGEFSNFSDPFDLGWNHELFLVSNFVCTLFFPFFTSSNKNSGKTLAIL